MTALSAAGLALRVFAFTALWQSVNWEGPSLADWLLYAACFAMVEATYRLVLLALGPAKGVA